MSPVTTLRSLLNQANTFVGGFHSISGHTSLAGYRVSRFIAHVDHFSSNKIPAVITISAKPGCFHNIDTSFVVLLRYNYHAGATALPLPHTVTQAVRLLQQVQEACLKGEVIPPTTKLHDTPRPWHEQ